LTVLGMIALFAAETPVPPAKSAAKPAQLAADEPGEAEEAGDSDAVSSEVVEWEDGPFAQWLEEKRELERTRRQDAKESEIADERRVDEILMRLHDRGPQSLSAEDRQILQRVSDRLRKRKEKKS
jgi:hypothetical protein